MSFEAPFTTHVYRIEFNNFDEPIYLIPFGDIHRFADNCHVDKYLEFLEWAKKKPRCYFLGMGDYDDFASTSERYGLAQARLHDTSLRYLDEIAKKRTMDFSKEVSFMKDNLIGMLEGNHHFKFSSGITSTQMICETLKTKYLGISSFIKIIFEHRKSNKAMSLDIWAHHGTGGGKRTSSSVNSVDDMQRNAEADIFLMGHDHKKWVAYQRKLRLIGGKGNLYIRERKILLGRTGSFQLGYVPGKSNYVSSGGMTPTDLGVLKIELTPRRKQFREFGDRKEELEVDIHCSI